MERRSVSPARPRNLSLRDVEPPSASPSPASESEHKTFADDLEEYDEVSEYIKEVDEILDFLKPFPRTQEHQEPQVAEEPLKPGLDHLENLIRLVEHLKDLKERNAQSRQKTQYLKDLKTLRDQKRRLREEEPLPPPAEPPRKPRASIPFQKSNRSISLSSNAYQKLSPSEHFFPPRTSLAPIKAKVSKWTKVKEAFRWEKAAQFDTKFKSTKPEKRSGPELAIPENTVISSNRLQVPGDKHGDPPSPADSVLSGQISSGTSTSCLLASSGYSGEHSSTAHSSSSVHLLDLGFAKQPLRPHYQDDSLSVSSSDDEKLDEVLAATNVAEDSMVNFELPEDNESRRSRSLDGGTILGPTQHFLQHLSKESLQESSSKLHKPQHKTPWGKVKDIIHTRRGSLKKKTKKREDFKAEAEAFSAGLDLPSPDDMPKPTKPLVEITPCERTQPILTYPSLQRLEHSMIRPFTPVLTLTLPSSEELQKLAALEGQDWKGEWVASPDDEASRISDSQIFDERGKMQGRSSRWGKVKRAFLTSGVGEEPSSAPSSPLHLGSFFSDIESDELSSGEWMEQERKTEIHGLTAVMKAEVQRNYSELQQKLCQELDASVAECEMLKDLALKGGDKLRCDDSDRIPRKPRESLTIPMPTEDDLSPEFKKKLDEWKKIKKTPPTPTSAKDDAQSHFMARIGEWQRWRPGSHKVEVPFKQEHHLHDEFYKKLEEWQMLKGAKRRSRSHSDRGKEDNEYQTPSPGLSRKNSKGAIKKLANSGKSSGTESLSGSLKEKDGRAGRKSHREKDLQWLEKELHKIEREKLRLEREREKYLEREARLEQMKRTMGTTSPTQEVLIQTATGFFRFEGISQKFTKKLYEWEKARGIAPEASTIALLETANVVKEGSGREDRVGLQRSKSVGSVIDTGSIMAQSMVHHPSSLSLNDVDDLEALEQAAILDASRASSEPGMEFKEEDEPEAIIVDVEDVVEETAAPLSSLQIQTHVPIYSYAPSEVTQLIDSSGSDGEWDIQVLEVKTIMPKNSEEKATLIDQNITLLERLEVKEALFREIENDLENIEGRISQESSSASSLPCEHRLQEGENLQHSFLEHSEQQEELAHDLVDNMWLLHAAHASTSGSAEANVNQVLDLSTQLLNLAQKLEGALSKRNAEVKNLRSNISRRRMKVNKMGSGKAWYSIDAGSTADLETSDCWAPAVDDEVDKLPSLITKKVLELKEGLNSLKDVSDSTEARDRIPEDPSESEENTASFTIQVARTGTRASITSIAENEPCLKKEKRPSLKILTRDSPPPQENMSPVTVTISSPLWKKTSEQAMESDRRLEKSKTQNFFSESAKETFENNLKLKNIEKEKKSPEVIKRKIKEKISEMQRLAMESRTRGLHSSEDGDAEAFNAEACVDKDKVVVVAKRSDKEIKSKKPLKTRRITDTIIYNAEDAKRSLEDDDNDDVFLNEPKVDEQNIFQGGDQSIMLNATSTPAFIFVPTTRKIISPVERDTSSSVISYVIDEIETKDGSKADDQMVSSNKEKREQNKTSEQKVKEENKQPLPFETEKTSPERKKSLGISAETKQGADIGIPPLPNSPSSTRKLLPSKESSPSIRMMIAKYNQKITEQRENETGGTSSPVGWRSPVLDRRIKEQLDRFQKDGTNALKYGGKFERREVQKSASAGFIQEQNSLVTSAESRNERAAPKDTNLRGILKSSSTGTVKSSPLPSAVNVTVGSQEKIIAPLSHFSTLEKQESSLAMRALKIKQAKAEFLSRGPSGQSCPEDSLNTTPTPSIVSVPFSWGASPEATGTTPKHSVVIRNRLSHVSVGSESSYDEVSCADELPVSLTKSVSAGMINQERWEMLRRKSESNVEETCTQKIIGQSPNETNLQTSKSSSRFGISNIKSRFRKVKMRKAKEKESAVSTLCRQSLFLDVSQSSAQASTSKSCPSSPVLNRSKAKSDESKKWISGKLFKRMDSKPPSSGESAWKK